MVESVLFSPCLWPQPLRTQLQLFAFRILASKSCSSLLPTPTTGSVGPRMTCAVVLQRTMLDLSGARMSIHSNRCGRGRRTMSRDNFRFLERVLILVKESP